MFHRTAALTAAILALSAVGGASVALAGGTTTTVTVPAPPPPPPPPVTVTTPAPPPVTVTVTKPTPAPKRHRHHHSTSSSAGGSHSGGSHSGSSNSGVSATDVRDTTPVALQTASTSETGTVPKGGIQAGGGGTAIAHDASSMTGVLGTAAGLLLVVTGTGLVLRRRVLEA